MLAPFDGFHETQHAVTGTCLISFNRNRYSVAAKAVRRAVQVRAAACPERLPWQAAEGPTGSSFA